LCYQSARFALATCDEFREVVSVPVQTVLIGSNGPKSDQQRKDNTMKRFAIAAVAALALTMACHQKASAWGWQLNGNLGISLGADFKCWCDCPTPGCYGAAAYGYPAYGYGPPAYAAPYAYQVGGNGQDPANSTARQPTPAALPQAPAVAAQPSLQQMGYYYYGGYGYGNYSYYQAPSYWYGR
jgi:hypothetical protein